MEPGSTLYVEHVDTWQAPPFVWHLYRLWDVGTGGE